MSWMVWTMPTAIFFSSIAAMLAGMTIWEILSPTIERKGFLPIATTRGDRLFIGLLGGLYPPGSDWFHFIIHLDSTSGISRMAAGFNALGLARKGL
ncbi:hypothetical protein HSBAA_27380 [Vreelandella sulfidaeris]|uniref:Uncharacterized protein n=1 Tax=Vreelandella sulfidaeris TaxID=115553 RepID=A0A455U5N4_9GAMM|nr:hypothetical protein HSBAA_27380 [Halomonas sulfidaeris]